MQIDANGLFVCDHHRRGGELSVEFVERHAVLEFEFDRLREPVPIGVIGQSGKDDVSQNRVTLTPTWAAGVAADDEILCQVQHAGSWHLWSVYSVHGVLHACSRAYSQSHCTIHTPIVNRGEGDTIEV